MSQAPVVVRTYDRGAITGEGSGAMERIVVGTDLSARSKGAVDLAADLALATGATLHVTHGLPPAPLGATPEAMFVPDTRTVMKDVETQLRALASDLERRGVRTEIHACPMSAADSLCEVAETIGADLIVVGNKRMTGAARVLGSVPNRVAHHAPCSVLVAKTG